MKKKKQIEEIKQILIKTCKRCRSFEEDYMQSKYAEALYNEGYRKIPEGTLVMTKEEFVKTIESGYVYDTTRGNKINIIQMTREIERKETATEILNRINEYYLDYNYDLKKEFEKLCKEYGVEVEE